MAGFWELIILLCNFLSGSASDKVIAVLFLFDQLKSKIRDVLVDLPSRYTYSVVYNYKIDG